MKKIEEGRIPGVRGRKPLPADEKRSEAVLLRLTRSDHAGIKEAAREAGVSIQEHVRRLIRRHLARRRK